MANLYEVQDIEGRGRGTGLCIYGADSLTVKGSQKNPSSLDDMGIVLESDDITAGQWFSMFGLPKYLAFDGTFTDIEAIGFSFNKVGEVE
jgi:hypothetical protein